MSTFPSATRGPEPPRNVLARVALPVLVFLVAWLAMMGGAEVSERELGDLHENFAAGVATRAYYALSLFVVGGIDLGPPVAGPLPARVALWLSYFAAPVVTAGVLVETALRMLSPVTFRLRRIRGHVIVVGAGRLGLLYVRRLRARNPRVPIVVVERDPTNPRLSELVESYRALPVIGDVGSDDILGALHLARARRVMLLTGRDFVNLDAAAKIVSSLPELRGKVVAHVSDLGFLHAIPEAEHAAGYETFNKLEAAAIHLVQEHLLARFDATDHLDQVILVGFGRFGQTVLHQLQTHALGKFGVVVIVDLEATVHADTFGATVGFDPAYDHEVIDGHLGHPAVWTAVDAAVGRESGAPTIVVGTGDDGGNLHAALDLVKRYPGAHIVVRSFGPSLFAERVSAEVGLHPFTLAHLVGEGMPERWFSLEGVSPRAPTD